TREVNDRAEGHDEVIEGEVTQVLALSGIDRHGPRGEVDRGHVAGVEADPFQHPAQRVRDLARLDGASGDLWQHRLQHERVAPVAEGDLDALVVPETVTQALGGEGAGEAAPEHEEAGHLSHRVERMPAPGPLSRIRYSPERAQRYSVRPSASP